METLREELERIFIFETTELKVFQDAITGTFDINKMDLRQAVQASLVLSKAINAMVFRVADEIDAMRGNGDSVA